jgi:hypothetical protein
MSFADIFQSQPVIASIGGALNAYDQRRAVERAGRQRIAQSREQIAFQEAIRQRQQELAEQEMARQQIMARVAGDAFGSSLGQFQGDFNQRIGDASSQIADFYREFLRRKTDQEQVAASIAPQATGPTADRQASAMNEASADVMGDAGRMADVQGFGEAMRQTSDVITGNEQLAALINNFARGSAGAGQAEIDAQAGRFFTRDFQPQPKGYLGDLFVGLGGLAGQYMANRPAPVDYSLPTPPGARSPDLRMDGGQVLRGPSGTVSRVNLGIR